MKNPKYSVLLNAYNEALSALTADTGDRHRFDIIKGAPRSRPGDFGVILLWARLRALGTILAPLWL